MLLQPQQFYQYYNLETLTFCHKTFYFEDVKASCLYIFTRLFCDIGILTLFLTSYTSFPGSDHLFPMTLAQSILNVKYIMTA